MTKEEMVVRIEGFADVREEASNEFSDLLDQLWNTAYNQGQEEVYDEGFDQGRSEANIPF